MTPRTIRELLGEHELFRDLPADDVELLAGCGINEVHAPGTLLAREGSSADECFVLRAGRVAIEVPGAPGAVVVETLGPGEVVGWSWIFPPYSWAFDVRALDSVHVIRLDGACLRGKCEDDPVLGYRLMKQLARLVARRLAATRVRLTDLYATDRHGAPT